MSGFAIIRSAEFTLIETLPPRARPRALAVIAHLRRNYGDAKSFSAGDRDFRDVGLAREAAGLGLKDLLAIGILEMLKKGTRSGRGRKTEYQFIHTRATEQKAGKTGMIVGEKAGKPGNKGRETRHNGPEKAGKPGNTIGTSSTSSQKSKEEEVPIRTQRHRLVRDRRRDWHYQTRMSRQRAMNERIGRAADALQTTAIEIRNKAGGWEAADFLARKFEAGTLSMPQLRAKLAESVNGFGMNDNGTGAPLIAAGGAG